MFSHHNKPACFSSLLSDLYLGIRKIFSYSNFCREGHSLTDLGLVRSLLLPQRYGLPFIFSETSKQLARLSPQMAFESGFYCSFTFIIFLYGLPFVCSAHFKHTFSMQKILSAAADVKVMTGWEMICWLILESTLFGSEQICLFRRPAS